MPLSPPASRPRRPARTGTPVAPRAATAARYIESAALYLLLAVVGLRPLIAESFDSAISGVGARLSEVAPPSPLTTLVLDGAIVVAALAAAAARAVSPGAGYRRCGLEAGLVILALAAWLSCRAAGNQRLAINASVDWLCLPLLTITLVQIVRGAWQVRLLLCVVLASAAAQAGKCFEQAGWEFAETREDYLTRKEQIWGPDADPAHVRLFEDRMNAAEATGFLQHSNIAAACLLMTGMAGIGLAGGRWRAAPRRFRRAFAIAGAVLAAAVCLAIPLTGSRGAIVAGIAAAVLLALRRALGGWMQRRPRATLALGWGVVALGVAATIGYGLARGALPGDSLSFRWQYWTASARMIVDHPLSGVGRENFGRHYLRCKTIQASEEVANPHNFLVQGAAEWGAIGAAGMLVMLIGGSIVATAAARAAPQHSVIAEQRPAARTQHSDRGAHPPGRVWTWALGLSLGIFVPRLALLGSDNTAFLVWETFFAASIWLMAFIVLALESDGRWFFGDDHLPGLATLLNLALFAFLVQDTINFALFVPATATTFFALVAVPIALRAAQHPARRRAWPWLVAALVLLFIVVWTLAPVAGADGWLRAARAARAELVVQAPLESPPARAYAAAAAADPLDPTPLAELADWLFQASTVAASPPDCLLAARNHLTAAIGRDPNSIGLWRRRGAINQAIGVLLNDRGAWRDAIADYGRALDLYPRNPAGLVELAAIEERGAAAVQDRALLAAALEHYRRALQLDDARPAWETIRRFTAQQRAAIEAAIGRVQGDLNSGAAG